MPDLNPYESPQEHSLLTTEGPRKVWWRIIPTGLTALIGVPALLIVVLLVGIWIYALAMDPPLASKMVPRVLVAGSFYLSIGVSLTSASRFFWRQQWVAGVISTLIAFVLPIMIGAIAVFVIRIGAAS